MTPDINPIYAGLERFCPRNSKNVSYVDEGLVLTCLDLIESCGWVGVVVCACVSAKFIGSYFEKKECSMMIFLFFQSHYYDQTNTFKIEY